MELKAAKANGSLSGLAYLDTSRGITPTVQKLTYPLHDKWVSLAPRYKERYQTSYPPFSFFIKFVFDQVKKVNDPSFILLTSGLSVSKPERFLKPNMTTPVSVRKTEV